MGPHRGPTSRYRGYAAGSPADNAVQTPARATCPRIPAPERRRSEVRPLWGRSKVGSLSAGALRLPAVINSATPMGSAAPRKHLSPRPHGRKPPHNARRHAPTGVPALYVDAAQRRWKIAVPAIALKSRASPQTVEGEAEKKLPAPCGASGAGCVCRFCAARKQGARGGR